MNIQFLYYKNYKMMITKSSIKVYTYGMVISGQLFATLAALPIRWQVNQNMEKYGIFGTIYTCMTWPYSVIYKWRNFVPNN